MRFEVASSSRHVATDTTADDCYDDAMTDAADDLLRFIAASPTPFHAVQEARRRLEEAGYRPLDESERWDLAPGARFHVVRGGSTLGAFEIGGDPASTTGMRLVGAHTDSPNLRIKPNAVTAAHGYEQLGVEVYGGALLHTWLDRDLSVAGRVVVRGAGGGTRTELVDLGRAVGRIPSLAIHLDRSVNQDGLKLNAQQHMSPVLSMQSSVTHELGKVLADAISGVEPGDVMGWDLSLYDVQPPARGGLSGELLHAARLDNLASCHAAVTALVASAGERPVTRGILLYDHEEVGSRSALGAASSFTRTVLERIARATEPSEPDAFARAMARSFLVSADMAHAVHPNYPDKHDPEHRPVLGGGPVIKVHASQAYATDGRGWGRFEALCREADVPLQRFVSRNDQPCGSTIGPIAAAELGIATVDIGNPMLSMHSCRETAGTADVEKMIAVLTRHFSG